MLRDEMKLNYLQFTSAVVHKGKLEHQNSYSQ
jgi:hypothetical protein